MTDAPQTASREPQKRAASMRDNGIIHVASLIYLGIIALCLLLPLAQTIAPIFGSIVAPLEERRQPSAFPALSLLLQENGDFALALNGWFDDRVGFRNLFVRSKNQIDYSLFGTSRKVYVGKDGWLFGRWNPDPVDDLNANELAALEARFVDFAKILEARGIRLIVIGYPDKSAIYPEMAPPELRLSPPGGYHDQLRKFLSSQTNLTFIDAEAILKQEKLDTREHLFAKTDMHVTMFAQLPIVKEIVAEIARREGRSDIQWHERLTLTRTTLGPGGEGRFLAPLVPLKEKDFPYYDGQFTVGGKESDGIFDPPDPHILDRADPGIGRPYDFEFRSRPELCPERLPGMVLFGNSFSDAYWALGLHRYFCFVRRARDPISRFRLFYETIPEGTKYFIFQYITPWLPGDSPPVDEIKAGG